tara:strand:+ start:101 stop:523 length:423 start_codon:yes stop_codon:yes gene_type:complete
MFVEWIHPLFGGALISFSLCVFIIINGVGYGIGDMLRNAVEREASKSWNNQVLFLIGLTISPITFSTFFYPVTQQPFQNEPVLMIVSGFVVGIGYQLCKGGLITRSVLIDLKSIKNSIAIIIFFLVFGSLSQVLATFVRV